MFTTTIKIYLNGGVVTAGDDLRVGATADEGADGVGVPAQHVDLVLRAHVPHAGH